MTAKNRTKREVFTEIRFDEEGVVGKDNTLIGGGRVNYFMIHRGVWEDVFGRVSFGAGVVLVAIMYRFVEMGTNRMICTKKSLAEFVGVSRQTLSLYWNELEKCRAVFRGSDNAWHVNPGVAQYGKKIVMPEYRMKGEQLSISEHEEQKS